MATLTEQGRLVVGNALTETGVLVFGSRLTGFGQFVFPVSDSGTLYSVQLTEVQHILDPPCSDETLTAS